MTPSNLAGFAWRAALRDLPRGRNQQPGNDSFQRFAHNIGWVTLSSNEVSSLVTDSTERTPLPASILEKVSPTLKDCVRGQCSDWSKDAGRKGALFTELADSTGGRLTMRITGFADVDESGRRYVCQLHGRIVFDSTTREVEEFQLVATGLPRAAESPRMLSWNVNAQIHW